MTWTAPADKGDCSTGSVKKYYIKIADQPIVDHPKFPDALGKESGFYQGDNIRQTWIPRKGGSKEAVTVASVSPHEAYGTGKEVDVGDLARGTYYLTIKFWDAAGNISLLSNIAKVKIKIG